MSRDLSYDDGFYYSRRNRDGLAIGAEAIPPTMDAVRDLTILVRLTASAREVELPLIVKEDAVTVFVTTVLARTAVGHQSTSSSLTM
jgi:hypothetical protein